MKKFDIHYFYVVPEESVIETETIKGEEYFSRIKLAVRIPEGFEYVGYELLQNKKIQLNFTGSVDDYGNRLISQVIEIELKEGDIKKKKQLEILFEHVHALLPKTVGESILVGV